MRADPGRAIEPRTRSEQSALQERIDALEGELAMHKAETRQLRRIVKEREHTIADHKQGEVERTLQHREERASNEDTLQTLQQTQAELAALKRRNTELRRVLRTCDSNAAAGAAASGAEFSALESSNAKLQDSLNAARDTLARVTRERDELRALAHAREEAVSTATRNAASDQDRFGAMESKADAATRTAAQLRVENRELRALLSDARAEGNTHAHTASRSGKDADALFTRVHALEEELATARRSEADLRALLQRTMEAGEAATHAAAAQASTHLTATERRLEEQVAAERARANRLAELVRAGDAESIGLLEQSEQLRAARAQIAKLTRRLEEKKEDFKAVSGMYRGAQRASAEDTLEIEVVALRGKNKRLLRRVEELEAMASGLRGAAKAGALCVRVFECV